MFIQESSTEFIVSFWVAKSDDKESVLLTLVFLTLNQGHP